MDSSKNVPSGPSLTAQEALAKKQELLLLFKKHLHNHNHLCGVLFDNKQQLFSYVRDKLIKVAEFCANTLLAPDFRGLRLKDAVICGSRATYLYNKEADLDLALIVELDNQRQNPEEAEKILKLLSFSYRNSRYFFNILNHKIDYQYYTSIQPVPGMYSLLDNRWIDEPVRRELAYTPGDFLEEYCRYAERLTDFADSRERRNGAFLTMESCRQLEQHLDNLQQQAIKARLSAPFEYNIDFQLFQAIKYCGLYSYFQEFISDSYNYNVNILEQG